MREASGREAPLIRQAQAGSNDRIIDCVEGESGNALRKEEA